MTYGSLSSGSDVASMPFRDIPSSFEPLLDSSDESCRESFDSEENASMSGNNLNLVNGVIVPVMLNIIGVVGFLRIGWGVGQAGVGGVALIFLVGETLAIFTVLSMVALVSNGAMKGGGSYFLISRTLGPEFGGSIGLLFYLAYAVGTAFYVIGFASEIVQAFIDTDEFNPLSLNMTRAYNTLIASAALAVVMMVSWAGAGFFTRINTLVFLIQFGAMFMGAMSIYFSQPKKLDGFGEYLGWSPKTFWENTRTDFTIDEICGDRLCSWKAVFGVLFPAMTGIMEGANLSGDLKNPSRDISRGTLLAVALCILTYAVVIIAIAGSFSRETLKTNMDIMASVVWPSKYVVIVGIAVSSFSSALGSVFGGSRILQALGRDDLPPSWGMSFFAKGFGHSGEPRRAVLATWVIAQFTCLLGDLDVVSPIISSFFLLSYATVNLTCFLADLSGTPNFRPMFRYYSRWQSFFGFALCIGGLFFLNVWYAVVACTALVVLMVYIGYKAPPTFWGDVSQSILFHQARKYLLLLDRVDHAKNWRPSLLLLLGPESFNMKIISFCNTLKKGGFYSIGDAVVGDLEDSAAVKTMNHLLCSWVDLLKSRNLKAIPEVTVAPSLRLAFQQLVQLSGVGGMRPNCVAIMFPERFGKVSRWDSDMDMTKVRADLIRMESRFMDSDTMADVTEECNLREPLRMSQDLTLNSFQRFRSTTRLCSFETPGDFLDVCRDILHVFEKHLIVYGHFAIPDRVFQYPVVWTGMYIDVWMIGSHSLKLGGTTSLQLQLAHILQLERKKCMIRLQCIVDESNDVDEQFDAALILAKRARLVNVACKVFTAPRIDENKGPMGAQSIETVQAINSIINSHKEDARILLLALPELPRKDSTAEDEHYLNYVRALMVGLPPLLLVGSPKWTNVISEEL